MAVLTGAEEGNFTHFFSIQIVEDGDVRI